MGRGSGYSWWRRAFDRAVPVVYGSGWARRAAYRLGAQGPVTAIRHEIESVGLPEGENLRLAFASDFHAGPLTDPRLFEAAAEEIARFDADLLLLGGDFVVLKGTSPNGKTAGKRPRSGS